MQVGQQVRVKNPTGGILAEHRFVILAVPEDSDGWVVIQGDIGGAHGKRNFKFHRGSLEVIGGDPKVTGDIPQAEHDAREDLLDAIEDYRNASIRSSPAHQALMWESLRRYRHEVRRSARENLVTAAKRVIEDAVWFPLKRLSAGDRQDDAWLVADSDMDALKEEIA